MLGAQRSMHGSVLSLAQASSCPARLGAGTRRAPPAALQAPVQYRGLRQRHVDTPWLCPCVQMPTGTGKTITLLSLITSYQLAHPEVSQLTHRGAR